MPERERWRALFEHSTDLVLVHEIGADGRPGRILEINPAACRRLGVSREEALRLSPRDFAVGLDEARIGEINARLRRDGELAFDARARPRMGAEFPIEVRSRLFEFEDRTVALLIARDISQRWLLEQQLREREAWYRALITNTLDTITVAAPDGTLRFVSPSITQAAGWKPAEIVGRSGFELVHPDDQAGLRAVLERLVRQPGTQARTEFRMRRRNGE
jgi:PAS domain S-box-containing protein